MSTPPPSPDDPSNRYSFDDPQYQQQPQQPYPPPQDNPLYYNHPRSNEEQFSLTEEIVDAVDEGFRISDRLLGCAWWSITLPFRMIGKVFDIVGDLF